MRGIIGKLKTWRAYQRRRSDRLRLLMGVLGLVAAWAAWSTLGRGEEERLVLSYEVRVVDADAAILEVTLHAVDISRPKVVLGYSTNAVSPSAPVSKFRVREATDAQGRPLQVIRDQGLWQIDDPGGSLSVRYQVYLHEGRPRGAFADEVLSQCDAGGARLVGSDVFLFPLTSVAQDIRVSYSLPPGWLLAHPYQSGPFEARLPALEPLYSSVVAIGRYRVLERRAGTCQLVLAMRGRFAFDDAALLDLVARLAQHQMAFFGGSLRSRYLFVVNPHPRTDDPERHHYFGMHFDGSMLLLIDKETSRSRLSSEPAQLCAHEFFHNWNGQLLSQEGYEMNWFVEGVTTFYAYQTRMDTGLLGFPEYAHELRRRYHEEYLENPAHRRLSPARAGMQVLQSPQVTQLLYASGVLLAAGLDLAIDKRSGGSASLDDLMRALVRRAQTDENFHLTRRNLETELRRLTGSDFSDWLEDHAYGQSLPELPAYITRES